MNSSLSIASRGAAAALVSLLPFCSTTRAQCPVDDATTSNGDCASAVAGSLGVTPNLSVQDGAEDYWSYVIPAGMQIEIDVSFVHVGITGDIDLELFDAASSCAATVDSSATISNLERVSFDNASANPVTLVLRVFLFGSPPPAGSCRDYDITATLSPTSSNCFGLPDDSAEDNDSCATALTPASNPLPNLFVSKTDEDFWVLAPLLPGEILTVDATFAAASGDLDLELIDTADCTSVIALGSTAGDNESVTYNNTTGAALNLVVRVFVWAGDPSDCNDYELSSSRIVDPCTLVPDDMFEENDDCASATPISFGTYPGLFVRKEGVDADWYSIAVPDGIKLTITITHVVADGNIDIELFQGCSTQPVDDSITNSAVEAVAWINTSGITAIAQWGVWIRNFGSEDCTTYDMQVQLSGGGPGNLVPYCFGDGSGVNCPCGNNSTPGHAGGCANSIGDGGILVASGDPSVSADTLNFDLTSAAQNSFALLVSGINQLPQMGSCIGCGIQVFDGLRCAGGGFLRHGSRALDSMGDTGNGWGPPGAPLTGLILKNGFMNGQTRHFFSFYRDDPAGGCFTGQNSSNGISVTFLP